MRIMRQISCKDNISFSYLVKSTSYNVVKAECHLIGKHHILTSGNEALHGGRAHLNVGAFTGSNSCGAKQTNKQTMPSPLRK